MVYVLSAALSLGSALESGPAPASDPPLHDTSECPALFGDDAVHESYARWRKPRLHEVMVRGPGVAVVHSVAPWRAPEVLRVAGVEVASVELVDVELADGRREERLCAIVDVAPDAAAACPAGLYALHVDDALGRTGQVLFIGERGVLVELKGKLGWLFWPGHRAPSTRMVWRSSYDLILDDPTPAAAAKKPAPRKTTRRKK